MILIKYLDIAARYMDMILTVMVCWAPTMCLGPPYKLWREVVKSFTPRMWHTEALSKYFLSGNHLIWPHQWYFKAISLVDIFVVNLFGTPLEKKYAKHIKRAEFPYRIDCVVFFNQTVKYQFRLVQLFHSFSQKTIEMLGHLRICWV